jgi:hypothetical protein
MSRALIAALLIIAVAFVATEVWWISKPPPVRDAQMQEWFK